MPDILHDMARAEQHLKKAFTKKEQWLMEAIAKSKSHVIRCFDQAHRIIRYKLSFLICSSYSDRIQATASGYDWNALFMQEVAMQPPIPRIYVTRPGNRASIVDFMADYGSAMPPALMRISVFSPFTNGVFNEEIMEEQASEPSDAEMNESDDPRPVFVEPAAYEGRHASDDRVSVLEQYIQVCYGSVDPNDSNELQEIEGYVQFSDESTDPDTNTDQKGDFRLTKGASPAEIRSAQNYLAEERARQVAQTGRLVSEPQGWPLSNQEILPSHYQERSAGIIEGSGDDRDNSRVDEEFARFTSELAAIFPECLLESGRMAKSRRCA